ncbi:MAG: archease [Bacteroidota bacterium]
MPYQFLEHTADIAVCISGDTPESLFTSAAEAWMEAAAEVSGNPAASNHAIELSESTAEELLVAFLSELNFLLLTRHRFCTAVNSLSLNRTPDSWKLSCSLSCTDVVQGQVILKEEIKAVTFHKMDITFSNGLWSTYVVFDI